MSKNGISHLQYKADRQLAKLQLAAIKRAASGRRSALDITELPTVYAPSDNDTRHRIDNPNVGGLVIGRPWVSGGMVDGVIWRRIYDGNFESDGSTFTRLVSEGAVDNIWNEGLPTNTTYEFIGYFRADWTGTWSFTVDVDDAAFFWIGPNAQAGGPGGNRDLAQIAINSVNISTYNIDLIEGNVYPFRLLCANGGGPGYIKFYWANGLTESRVLSLDASVLADNGTAMFSTDVGGVVADLHTPEVEKVTTNGGIVNFAGTSTSGAGHGYVTLNDDFYVDFTGGMAVSVWAKISAGCGPWGRLIDFGQGSATNNILIAVYGEDTTKLCVSIYQGNTGANVVVADIPFDQWKLYTWTADGSNYRFYINDQLVYTFATNVLPSLANRNYCYIGGSNWVADANFKGSIASVEIYNRPLDLNEVTGLYNERKGRFL